MNTPDDAKSQKNIVPDVTQWGDCTVDDDMLDSYNRFFGKTLAEMHSFFLEFPMEAMEELYHMPPIPFQYYIWGFEFLSSPEAVAPKPSSQLDNYSDVASCFLRLVRLKLRQEPTAIAPIMKDILPLVEFVASHQEDFGACIEIYGSFEERSVEIKGLYRDSLTSE